MPVDQNKPEEPIRATLPLPDHSDLRGFSYRAPTNIQGYNDSPRPIPFPARPKHRKGFWAALKEFFRGETTARPMNPEMVTKLARPGEPIEENLGDTDPHGERRVRDTRRRVGEERWPG